MPEATPRPLLAWLDVLQRIEESLAQTLRLAPDPLAHSRPAPADSNPLAKLDERQALWQARLDEARAPADALDQQLAADREMLAAWREQASKAREMLAQWLGRAV